MIELLENPIIQLLLIAAAGMGLSWISEREEQRRVAQGLPYRPLKERIVEGLGLSHERKSLVLETEDIWIQAARELELPLEKVLLLKQKVLNTKVQPVTKPKRKDV